MAEKNQVKRKQMKKETIVVDDFIAFLMIVAFDTAANSNIFSCNILMRTCAF